MKQIPMKDLVEGDILWHDMKLIGREAFKVKSKTEKAMLCESRTTKKQINKSIGGYVYFLRHE